MSITTTVLNKDFSVDVDIINLPAIDVTKLTLVDTVFTDEKREALYQVKAGDPEYPASLRLGHYRNAKANGGKGSVSISAKLTNFAQKSDTDGDVIWTLPESWTLAKNAPGGSIFYDVNADIEAIGCLISAYLHTVAGVIDNANIDELKFGIVNRILDHTNS